MLPVKNYKTAYSLKLEISFIIILLSVIALFYFSPHMSGKFKSRETINIPTITILEIPRTMQLQKKIAVDFKKPVIPIASEQDELPDSIRLVFMDERISADTSLINQLYFKYQNFLTQIQEFNPDSIRKMNKGPAHQYEKYLHEKLSFIYNSNYPSDSVFFDEHLNREMGRPEAMIGIPIPPVVSKLSKLFKSKNKNGAIKMKNIIECESHFFILGALWQSSPQTVYELYKAGEINRKNTLNSLQQSLSLLSQNGLLNEQKRNEQTKEYSPVYTVDEMIDFVNKFLVQNKEDKKVVNKLNSILYFLIQIV